MQQIRRKVDDLKGDTPSDITQSKLNEYGLTGRTLRPYQLDGVSFMRSCHHREHGCILGDEMGLGKTIQVISTLVHLKGSEEIEGPFLVLCPLSVLDDWKSEFKRFAKVFKVVSLVGDKDRREEIKNDLTQIFHLEASSSRSGNTSSFNVLLTTYEICIREVSFLSKFHWKVLAIDEAHRLKNSNSLLHQELITKITKDFTILLTGTPVQNNLRELYSLLSFVSPTIFQYDLEEEFLENFKDLTGKTDDLQYLLSPFLLRRVKSEVMKDLPQKSEVVLYTGLTDLQKKYYKAILTKDLGVFSNEGTNRTGLKNILVRLRQCANHPYLFDGVEPEPFVLGEHLVTASGKLYVLDRLLSFLQKRNHKVLVFSQMTRMLDILQDYFGFRGFTYERLDGSVRGEERYLAIRNFNDVEDTFAFLLSTKAGGQGLNLTSADTVIFIDSDYNPQNDLQAAARAHRLGQTRPVKIIRLMARNTVEEIILNRANEKLKLNNNVIEGGQFSSISQGLNPIADTNQQLSEILKFGLDKLFDADENQPISDEEFERILGKSSNGKWLVDKFEEDEEKQIEAHDTEVHSMYVYEGHDYSKEAIELDKAAFDKMASDILEEMRSSERATRSIAKIQNPNTFDLPTRKRKILTTEELKERRKKREENAEKKARLKEEKEQMKEEARKKRIETLWKENNYNSLNITLSEDEDDSEEELNEEDEEQLAIQYVKGDVTQPVKTKGNPAIIVHCVDDSGYWGKGGLFTAIAHRSSSAVHAYELAGAMEDLHLGHAHLTPFTENEENVNAQNFLSLIVAQSRDKYHRLLPMNLSSLSEGLQRVYKAAKKLNATVHLPRIGHSTPGFNWYGTERLIRKHLASRGVYTLIYYFPRKVTAATKMGHSSREDSSEKNEKPSKTYRHVSERSQMSSEPSTSRMLPDFFSGVCIYFKDVPGEKEKKLRRYVIAYNGDVTSILCNDVTHIVCDVKRPPSSDKHGEEVKFVNSKWVEDCVKKQQLLNTARYLVE